MLVRSINERNGMLVRWIFSWNTQWNQSQRISLHCCYCLLLAAVIETDFYRNGNVCRKQKAMKLCERVFPSISFYYVRLITFFLKQIFTSIEKCLPSKDPEQKAHKQDRGGMKQWRKCFSFFIIYIKELETKSKQRTPSCETPFMLFSFLSRYRNVEFDFCWCPSMSSY